MPVYKLCNRCLRPEPCKCPPRRSPDNRASAHARGYDAKWKKTRASYLRAYPFCEQEGCEAKATDVHHLDGLGPRGPYGHDPANLQALCHSHHSQETAKEQPGGWAAFYAEQAT